MSVVRWVARIALGGLLFLWCLWTVGTIYYCNLSSEGLRAGMAAAYVLVLVFVLARLRPFRRGLGVALAGSAGVALVYALTPASNTRDWLPDVAVAATTTLSGDHVTVHGVRNFRYRSENDFDARWEDRSYDLGTLHSLDLLMSYWGPADYCHTFLSFGFADGQQLAISVETRKEVGEEYSTLGGLFKRYELVYIFADERDLVGLRTNHRGEHVYLYRLRADPARLRELFLSYVTFANDLALRPQFYGVLENSCGVNILHRVADESGKTVFVGRDALLNGHWDEHLYERGVLDRSHPFAELRELSRVDERARAAGDAPDFSQRIRVGLPDAPRE